MNNLLKDFCRNNDLSSIKEILNVTNCLDVLTSNGYCFRFAISKENTKICQNLLEYFENKQFAVKDSLYESAKEKLTEVLENAVDGKKVSSEMQRILSPYIDFNNSLENRSDDSMFEALDVIKTTKNEKKTTPMKKSHSTGDLSNSTNIFSSDSSSNHSSGKKNNIIDNMFLHDKNHDFENTKFDDADIIGEIQSAEAF